jgi:ribosome biogenesis protein Tsr3
LKISKITNKRATAHKLVSPEDQPIIMKNGICVIDCSWAKIDEINFKSPFEHERKRLIFLILY